MKKEASINDASNDTDIQSRKKARVASELSRCLDIIIDHSNSLLPPSLHISEEYLAATRPSRSVKSISQLRSIQSSTSASSAAASFLPNMPLLEAGGVSWSAAGSSSNPLAEAVERDNSAN